MRTVRCSGCQGVSLLRGFCLGGVCLGGGVCPGGMSAPVHGIHPPSREQNHRRLWKHNLAAIADGNKSSEKHPAEVSSLDNNTIHQSKFQYEMINLRACHLRINFYIRVVIIMIACYKHDPLSLIHILHLYVYQYRQMFLVWYLTRD